MNAEKSLLKKLKIFNDENGFWQFFDKEFSKADGAYVLSFLNAHAFNLCYRDDAFKKAMFNSNLLLRDGVGIKIALAINGAYPGLNLNGTDLIPKIIDRVKGKVALYGTREPNLGDAARLIESRGLEVICYMNGFEERLDYVKSIQHNRPDIIILAMGMPKQEILAEVMRSVIDWPCLIINGGAILDFMSGRVTRAPGYIRSIGFEWLFRLLSEPRRLWRRYLIGNFEFFYRVITHRIFG